MNDKNPPRLAGKLIALTVATLLSQAGIALAQAGADAKRFDIGDQLLATALNEFARQADRPILFSTEVVNAKRTEGVKGELDPEAALQALLKGTGLTYRRTAQNTFLVDDPRGRVTGAAASERLFRLAFARGDAEEPYANNTAESTEARVPALSPAVENRVELREVIITGSRLNRVDDEGPSPVMVFDRARIDQLGVTSLPDLLLHLSQQPFQNSEGLSGTAGGRYARLRGLSTRATMVLINGRRAAASSSSGAFNAVDMSRIPVAAIERVEVLADSASAIYGADAIGGVINIILKKDITRPTVELRYGGTDGGGEERRVSLSAGHSGERLRISALFDHFDRGYLLGEARDRYSNQDYTRYGSLDRRALTTNPGNVTSRTAANLPGLPSRTAAIPEGSTGVGLTPADFAATAGQQNLTSLGQYTTILPDVARKSASAFAELDLGASTTLFGELVYENGENRFLASPSSSALLVPGGNPFNPFDVDVTVNYLFTGAGPRERFMKTESTRVVLGGKGDLAGWQWELSAGRHADRSSMGVNNVVNLARVNAALAETDSALAFNPFQAGPGGSPNLLRSLVDHGTSLERHSGVTTSATAQVRGALFSLPAGEAEMVVGTSWLNEETSFISSNVDIRGADRTVWAGYTEIGVPLVGANMRIPGMHALGVTLAARYDSYSDFGDSFNPQFGLTWKPVPDLLVRASYGTSFSPPALFRLYQPQYEVPGNIIFDPQRNETVSIPIFTGGNSALQAEEGESVSTGFVFTPASVKGLRLAATYWRIRMDNLISSVGSGLLLAHEDRFPERIRRATPTEDDILAGRPGALLWADGRQTNFGLVRTSGIDWDVSYALSTEWGRFTPTLAATWVNEYLSEQLPGTPVVERVDVASTQGTIPKWKGSATLAWAHRNLGASVSARYTHSYADATSAGVRTGRRIPSQTLIDLQASAALEGWHSASWLQGLKIAAGVTNLFDKDAPFSEVLSTEGFDYSQSSLIGRSAYVTLTKTF
jgi:iron complex outermembrane receptor protein